MSAIGVRPAVWYSLVLLCVIACVSLFGSARADSSLLAVCQRLEIPIVTVGAPVGYRTLLAREFATEDVPESEVAKRAFCPVFAFGNDYQILDWLENGQLAAGIMSEFSASVLDASQIDRVVPLYDISTEWPFATGRFRKYDITLQFTDDGSSGLDPLDQFDDMLRAIAAGTPLHGNGVIVDSHLSTAFPVILDFVRMRAEHLDIDTNTAPNRFWETFLSGVRYQVSGGQVSREGEIARVSGRLAARADGVSLLEQSSLHQDVFVYDARLRDSMYDGLAEIMPRKRWTEAVEHWIYDSKAADLGGGDTEVADYLHRNFDIREAGFRKQRHFRFTLHEISRIMRAGSTASTALVLTGGGVKAAYQTRLIDHLYGEGVLANEVSAQDELSTQVPIVIDHVIGTSGGALLGLFVSTIDGSTDLDLTNRIWYVGDEGRYVESHDLFPIVEMPRYLTLLISSMTLILFISIGRRVPWVRNLCEIKTIDAKYRNEEGGASGVQLRLFWIVFLIASPWILKFVIGEPGLQHVPAIAGAAYFVCLLLAVYSDNRLILTRSFAVRKIRLKTWHVLGSASGLFLIVFSVAFAHYSEFSNYVLPLIGKVDTATLLCCVGLCVLAAHIHCILVAQKPRIQLMPRAYIRNAFVVLIAVPALAYLGLVLTESTLFELTAAFWVRFLTFSAVASIAVLAMAYVGPWANVSRNFVRNGLDLLVSEPAGKNPSARGRRYSRAMWFFGLSFLWWNWIMAPSIYGNEDAKAYLSDLYDGAVCPDRHSEMSECRNLDPDEVVSVPPKTPFVISATSLENKKERYFVLHPDAYKADCTPETSLGNDRALHKLLKTDPRWQSMGCHPTSKRLVDTAFASGSPFPVFPATLVPLADTGGEEWLVDGGFAHNVPIEAANALGAKTILVISSSPLYQAKDDVIDVTKLKFGNLSHNLTRLFPYLFERSQIEDAIGAQQALVVSLSPTGSDEAWPALTDFRATTVARMILEAEADIDRRIGRVESWGPARCIAGGVEYQCKALLELIFPQKR